MLAYVIRRIVYGFFVVLGVLLFLFVLFFGAVTPEDMARRAIGEKAPPEAIEQWITNHGYDRPQLFNLDDDPGEWRDLGADPQFAGVRDDLMHQVLDGWSAEDVLHYFEVWDADRSIRDRFDAAARIRPNEAPDPWVLPDDCTEFEL